MPTPAAFGNVLGGMVLGALLTILVVVSVPSDVRPQGGVQEHSSGKASSLRSHEDAGHIVQCNCSCSPMEPCPACPSVTCPVQTCPAVRCPTCAPTVKEPPRSRSSYRSAPFVYPQLYSCLKEPEALDAGLPFRSQSFED